MKKSELKQIIREELNKTLLKESSGGHIWSLFGDIKKEIEEEYSQSNHWEPSEYGKIQNIINKAIKDLKPYFKKAGLSGWQ